MNIRILILALFAYALLTPTVSAQDQCDTTNQCKAIYGNSANDCFDSRSNSSICMCGSSRCDSVQVDQCNTTSQCKATYGNSADDCLNSGSNRSICMCGSQRCDVSGGGGGNGGGNGGGDEFGGAVVQPSSSCSNEGNSIPNNVRLHNIHSSNISRNSFGNASRWYREEGDVQRFQLHNGDQNQRTGILRPRIEAFAPPESRFKRGSGWHEFSANYYLADWDDAQRYALFQIKTNDASNFIIQVLIDDSKKLEIARRSKGSVIIMNDAYRKPFNLRVRSNGYRFEVYLNCQRVLAENYPQPNLVDNNTQNGFRWGLYRQKADDDKHDGTTTLYVTGVKYD